MNKRRCFTKSDDNKDNEGIETKGVVPPKDEETKKNIYFRVNKKDGKKYEIEFVILKEEIPDNFQSLYIEIEKTVYIIKTLKNTTEEIKDDYFDELLSIAQVGLVGEKANPDIGKKALELLKDEIVTVEGQRIKNGYIKDLGLKTAILLGVLTILYIVIQNNKKLEFLSGYIIVFIGSGVGTWVSFGARKVNITFEQLSIPEEDMMSPWIRLIYIGISSMIFMLFLNTKIVKIEIGSFDSTKIANVFELQLLVGIICGLVESKIGLQLHDKATKIIMEDNSNEKNN